MNSNGNYNPEMPNLGQNRCSLVSCGLILKLSVNSNLSYSPEMLDSGQNREFFVLCDLKIWRMTLKNNRAPLLRCFKLCASFHIHKWILAGVTVRKRSIWVKLDVFFPCDLKIWQMTLKNNRALLLWCFKFCAWFGSHWWIQTGVTVWKPQFGSKSTIF